MNTLDDFMDRRRHPGESPAMRQTRRLAERSSMETPKIGPATYPAETSPLHGPGGPTVGVRLTLVPDSPARERSPAGESATTAALPRGSEGPAAG